MSLTGTHHVGDTGHTADHNLIDAQLSARRARDQQVINVMDYGAVGDGTTDDTAAIQAAFNAATSFGVSSEGPTARVDAPGGYQFKTTSPITISKPVAADFQSFVYYSGTGAAFIIGAAAPTGGRNTGYDLFFTGLRQTNGNGALPTSANASGVSGIEIRNMQFSRVAVGTAIAFTKAGVFLNSTNDAYTGQHIQDNEIIVGQTAYNGWGVLALSTSAATGAVQVNTIEIRNAFSNWIGVQLDSSTYAGNSNNNIVRINALDSNASGQGFICHGAYNDVLIGYLAGSAECSAEAYYNTVKVMNHFTSGVSALNDLGHVNWMTLANPDSSALPVSAAVSSGAVTRNNYGVPVAINLYAQMQPSTTTAVTVSVAVGESSSPGIVYQAEVPPMAAPAPFKFPLFFLVGPGRYWSVTATIPSGGAVNLSNATIHRAS